MNGLEFCQKTPKIHFWTIFWVPCQPDKTFFKNQALPLFLLYDYLTSCKKKKTEKAVEPILRSSVANGRTKRQKKKKKKKKKNGQRKRARFIGHFCYRGCPKIVLLNFKIPYSD